MRKMKDSRVPWIGEIPEEWEVGKIKNFYDITLGKMLTPAPSSNSDSLENYLCAQNLTDIGINTNVIKQMWFSPNEKIDLLLKKGDVLVVEGGNVGLCCVYNSEMAPCYIQNALHRIRTNSHYINKFIYYWMKFVEKSQYLHLICNKATIAHYTKERVANTPIVVLHQNIQNSIAAYLDTQCARIDAIIANIRSLIAKLKEYRQSVITEAVTKGLDPDVPMKDSGVSWIGKVPEGWQVCPLKWRVHFVKTGGTPAGAQDIFYADDGFPWFTPSDFGDSLRISESAKKLSDLGIKEVKIFPKNCVLMIGIGATMGKVALSSCDCSANQQINSIVCDDKLFPLFLTFFLKTITDYLFKCGKFTTLPILNQEETKSIIVPVPSFAEQQRIADYLDTQCAKIDTALARQEELLTKLEAYKKSLIYECVTGKREVPASA